MATGASCCDLAIILVDARHGVMEQTRRHSFISALLGIKHFVIAVNKMDAVDWSEEVFETIHREYRGFAAKLELSDLNFIPMSALLGDNVVEGSENMPWFSGRPLLSYLESVHIASDHNFIDVRFPVQYVIRPDLNFRGFAGTVASGVLRKGAEVLALPSKQRSRIKAITTYDGELTEAFPPQAVVVQLEDEIDLSRGDMLVHPGNVPDSAHDLEAMVVWMDDEALKPERQYWVRFATRSVTGMVSRIHYRVDTNTFKRNEASELRLNEIARVSITCTRAVEHDNYQRNRATGAFVLIDRLSNATAACGMLIDRRADRDVPRVTTGIQRKSLVPEERRQELLGQRPVTVWLTGLTKSGKSSIAYALEQALVDRGRATHVLDGARLRQGLNIDLGFTGDDRHENIRRAGAIARLFGDAGLITIAAFVSPFAEDRQEARTAIGEDRFIEVYCSAALDVCEARDTEGVYARARSGEIAYFSGISAPYEPPTSPELDLPTGEIPVEESVRRIISLLEERGFLSG